MEWGWDGNGWGWVVSVPERLVTGTRVVAEKFEATVSKYLECYFGIGSPPGGDVPFFIERAQALGEGLQGHGAQMAGVDGVLARSK